MNTHYAVLAFSGDHAGEHPSESLRGKAPSLELIACGPEDFCWEKVAEYTAAHPLEDWQTVEVLARAESVVADEQVRADAYRERLG